MVTSKRLARSINMHKNMTGQVTSYEAALSQFTQDELKPEI